MQCGRLPGLQASSFLDFSRHKRQRTHEEGTLSHQGTPQHSPSRPAPKKANEGSAAVASHMGSSGQFDINSAESLASRGLDLLAAAAEWGLIVDASQEEEEEEEEGGDVQEGGRGGEEGVWGPEQLSESESTETESDIEVGMVRQGRARDIGARRAQANKKAHAHATAQQQGPGLPTFISKGIESLGPPPWSYELLLDFMGVPHGAAADPRYAAAAQVASQVASAQRAAPGQQPFKVPKKKKKKKSKGNGSSSRRQMMVSSVLRRSPARSIPQPQQQQQQQPQPQQQPQQREQSQQNNNGSESGGNSRGDVGTAGGGAEQTMLSVGMQQGEGNTQPGSGGAEAKMDECMKVVYGNGGARLSGGRVYMPLLFVTQHFKGVEFPADVFSDIYVNGECIARDHTVRINRAMNKTRSSGIGNHFITGHQRLLSKYKDVKITCLELLASDRRLGIHVCSQGVWELPQLQPEPQPEPQPQPQQQQQQQQLQQQPQSQQLESSAPCVYELPVPLPLPLPPVSSSQQQSLSISPALVMAGSGDTAACAAAAAAAAAAASAAGVQGVQQVPGNDGLNPPAAYAAAAGMQGVQQVPGNDGLNPAAAFHALLVPGSSSISSISNTQQAPQQPGSGTDPSTSLHALSSLGALSSLAQLPGSRPSAHATHACATHKGSTSNVQGSYSGCLPPADVLYVASGTSAAPSATPVAGTAEITAAAADPAALASHAGPAAPSSHAGPAVPASNAGPVPPSAPPIPGPRVNDGRVFVPLQIIHDHYSREDYPLQIRVHVFVNHVLLARGMEAKMVRYRKSANRANHFCTGLRGVLARFNDVRSHCVEQDEDGCLKISLLAA